VCPHVAQDLDRGVFGNFEKVSVMGSLLLCRECYLNNGFDQFRDYKCNNLPRHEWPETDETVLDKFEDAYKTLEGRRGYCAECVAAIQVNQARKDGEKDPFPIYEKTMTSHDQVRIQALADYLTRHFDFQGSIVTKTKVAAFVTPGNYRQPTTVKIYYVLDQHQQDKIILLTSDFLKDLPLNQAKVEFWEAEKWTAWKTKNGTAGSRGKEVLQREAYLNCE
jgi:hypothetical protein